MNCCLRSYDLLWLRCTWAIDAVRNRIPAEMNGISFIALAWLTFGLSFENAVAQTVDPLLNRPSAVMIDRTGERIIVANAEQSKMAAVSRRKFELQGEPIPVAAPVLDMMGFGDTSRALTVSSHPPNLSMIDLDQQTSELFSVALSGRPARLAISVDQKFAAVTMTWDRSVGIVQLGDLGLVNGSQLSRYELEFPPKEIIAIDPAKFLIADAFGGSLAILDAAAGKVLAQHQIQGHHIGGLCYDESSKSVLITHQKLSKIAETSYPDIHWGTLMQNLVSQVPLQSLLEPVGKISSSAKQYQLGNPGKGAADPAGIVSWSDGQFAVAISGGNEVAFGKLGTNDLKFVPVGAKPAKLLKLDENQLLCINELDDTVSVISRNDEPQLIKTIGEPKPATSPAAQGERDFYSGRLSHDGWISCSSCHVDGFTPDLVSDTFGDGGFGNAKRIPSLFGATATGPWGWNGRKKTLEDQIQATLTSTMHRDAEEQDDIPDDEVVKRLVRFLETLEQPSQVRIQAADNEEDIRLGSMLFHSRDCSKCHDPGSRFTSADVYDVGVTDEFGQKRFNPPSLSNLKVRRTFFHDGRFKSLDEVLRKHPQDEAVFSDMQLQQLKAFLLSL